MGTPAAFLISPQQKQREMGKRAGVDQAEQVDIDLNRWKLDSNGNILGGLDVVRHRQWGLGNSAPAARNRGRVKQQR